MSDFDTMSPELMEPDSIIDAGYDYTDVGYTTGQIATFEQLGDWNTSELAASMGIFLEEGSIIRISRACTSLPQVNSATGWLRTDMRFGWVTKIRKWLFAEDSGASTDAVEDESSPAFSEGYEDWEIWADTEDGVYANRSAVGIEQFLDYYDYWDRIYGIPDGADSSWGSVGSAKIVDDNQLLRWNKVEPYANGRIRSPNHPYIDAEKTSEINIALAGAYSSDSEWAKYFAPDLAFRGVVGSEHGSGFTYHDQEHFWHDYDVNTQWITAFYAPTDGGIFNRDVSLRYLTPDSTKAAFFVFLESEVTDLATQKLSTSSKFSESKQRAEKIAKSSLSALSRGTPTITTAVDAEGPDELDSMFTYDTEVAPAEGADDYSY